jgi:hypothetical protein
MEEIMGLSLILLIQTSLAVSSTTVYALLVLLLFPFALVQKHVITASIIKRTSHLTTLVTKDGEAEGIEVS